MLVELDVFSGRPNPRWELDSTSSESLRQLLSQLQPSRQTHLTGPALGYRGFKCSDAEEQVHACRGLVQTPRGILDDPLFTLERFLLSCIPAEFASLGTRIAAELGIEGRS